MSQYKEEIVKLADTTLLTNKQIAKVVGCGEKTVYKYAGSFASRCEKKSSMNDKLYEIQKTVLLPDIHYPHIDPKVMESVNQFIFEYEPHELVYMGDQMSLDCISGWNKRKPLLKEGQRLVNDYETFDRDILRVHETLTADDTRRTFLIGNHEERVNWYIQEHPELEQLIDIDRNLNLTERGYNIIPFNQIYKLGKLSVIHGYYWNKYHAAKTLESFEGNVVYAHVHNPQIYSKVSPVDRRGYHMAACLGCLCNIKPDYKKGLPNFWVNQFGVVEWLPATGYFNLTPITIIDGTFMWNGTYYGKNL